MLTTITPLDIIELSQPLISDYIEDMEEYQSDINSVFNGVKDIPLLYSLLKEEQLSYVEERTLKIAKLLEKASNTSYFKTYQNHKFSIDERITFSDRKFRKKPELYFYERAAANGSIEAMSQVACLLVSGEGDIEENPERSRKLREYAAEHGDIKSLHYLNRDNSFYKTMMSNGNYMAEIVLFLRCFRNNRKFFAKRHLDRLLNNCNQDDKKKIICYLEDLRCDGDFSSVIKYIRGETSNFKIVTHFQLMKKYRG